MTSLRIFKPRAMAACAATGLLLAACASYQPLPLSERAPAGMTVEAGSLPFPALAAHRFNPDDGLDIIEVAMLAVVNNPDLRVARSDAAVAHAQAFAAGLLPDPQLALSGDLHNNAGPSASKAYSLGMSYDVASLLTHPALHGAADREAEKVDLTLLWQEWQVVSQAQLLFVKLSDGRRIQAMLTATHDLYADRLSRMRAALAQGLLNSDAVTPNLVALQDVERQLFDNSKLLNQAAHDLNALLGLAPETVLALQDGGEPGMPDASLVESALGALPQRRPDLRALQSAFAAQDQRYRAAILAQFPALSLGFTHARDNSFVVSNGVGINLSLPFFNRNRGNVAIEQATRQKLLDDYQARVQAARNDVHRILQEQTLNIAQLDRVEHDLVELKQQLARSDSALRTGNADVLLYVSARSALLAKEMERVSLQQAVLEQRIGLRTLLGIDMTRLESTTP